MKSFKITPDTTSTFALECFGGWHFATDGRVQKTAFCALLDGNEFHKTFLSDVDAFNEISDTSHAFCIGDSKVAANGKLVYDGVLSVLRMVHNNGLTLQHRAENMILTRPMRVLVKGPCVAHLGTVCELEKWIVCTPSFYLVQHKAVQSIISESKKIVGTYADPRCLLSKLSTADTVHDSWSTTRAATPTMTRLSATPTFAALFEIMPKLRAEPCAILIQSTAIMISGYEDAGTKFRHATTRPLIACLLTNLVCADVLCAADVWSNGCVCGLFYLGIA